MNAHYDIAIRSYWALICLVARFYPKAKLLRDGRRYWRDSLAKKRNVGEKWFWFHCASAGEFEDILELLKSIRIKCPDKKFLLSFHSPSGYLQHSETPFCDHVMYIPLDTSINARDFLEILQPETVFFSRSELWLHFLEEVQLRGIAAYLISLSMTEKSGFLRWPMRGIYARCFRVFTTIFCKDERTKILLSQYFQIESKAILVGNTRVDRVQATMLKKEKIDGIDGFVGNRFCVVVGSSLPRDERNALVVMSSLSDLPIQWIIVPHEIDREAILTEVSKDPNRLLAYWNLDKMTSSHRVLYIDFVGKLKHIYQHADFALIGGGHDRIGIHNILEATVYGVPVSFGPRHRNYPEALDLLAIGGAAVHNDAKQLEEIIRVSYQRQDREDLRLKLIAYISENIGATARIMDTIFRD